MYPSFVVGRTVAGAWEYLTPGPVPRHEARRVFEAADAAKGRHEDVQYVEVAVYDVPKPSQAQRFTVAPAAAPPQAAAVAAGAAASTSSEKASAAATPEPTGNASPDASGTVELSQAAKPGLDDVLAPAPETKPETRGAYAARVAKMARPALILEAHSLRHTFPVSVTNADLRKVLVDAKFPLTPSTEPGSGARASDGAAPAP